MKQYIYFVATVVSLLSVISITVSAQNNEPFLHCLSYHLSNSPQNSKLTYTPKDSSYLSILNSTIMNRRTVLYPSTLKPFVIITPFNVYQIQATVLCAKSHGVEVRTRSGGHDSEGLSYKSSSQFVVIDLKNMRKVKVDVAEKTAWVEAGATLGEVYYNIAEKSKTLAFPAGLCYTVGVGGHFSGGGYGILTRKYGLAADNVLDAHIVNAEGRVLDSRSMGKDLFWAIRGGGAASFGIVVAWKIRLVDIPPKVTVFTVTKNLDNKETGKLIQRWQQDAHELPGDLLLFIRGQATNSTLQTVFISVFLGGPDKLLETMRKRFPELGLQRKDCIETTWIDTITLFNGFPAGSSPKVLLDRTKPQGRPMSFMAKVDYIENPIPGNVIKKLWEKLYDEDELVAGYQLFPYGAKMSEISKSDIPYPHRAGNLYEISYLTRWDEKGDIVATKKHMNWTRSVYHYMTPYVSRNPRGAYLNYRDLDLGKTTWGKSYFKGNFERLIDVKRKVDPTNFFKNEQSIPLVPEK